MGFYYYAIRSEFTGYLPAICRLFAPRSGLKLHGRTFSAAICRLFASYFVPGYYLLASKQLQYITISILLFIDTFIFDREVISCEK